MPASNLANANVNVDATSIAPTGGTSTALASIGDSLNKHALFLATSGVEFKDRVTFDFTTKAPSITSGSPSGFTQARSGIVLKFPITLATGERIVNTARVEIATDVETTTAEKVNIRYYLSQLLSDIETDDFCNNQSLA